MTDHEALMRRAIAMAETARLRARPNPWVGAVLVCADGSLFEGATQAPGGAHAEIECLRLAHESGRDTTGAHFVVTLEPCSHTGRTGPCTEAIIAAGVASVTVAISDPDERVSGSGIDTLRAAGIDVTVGVLADDVTRQLAPYLHHRRTGRPFVVAKMACTLDWRTVAPAGERWITGDDARREVHRLRAESDAIAVGAGTVRADDPELTVRLVDGPSPRRVVLTRTPLPVDAKVHPCLEWAGSLEELLDSLGSDGVVQLLVEGGAETVTSFHRAGLIDRWILHVAPVVSGDDSAPGLFADDGDHAPEKFDLVSHRQIGADLEMVFDRTREKAGAR
ncbi:MAG: bifunctional diaminohydroxyphosphoribosylaminopyrimidine deaminase/5-amino-6-(5-phosphoribosylamino)uracil reductase RibD [Ilumatobacteraceae bacterium]